MEVKLFKLRCTAPRLRKQTTRVINNKLSILRIPHLGDLYPTRIIEIRFHFILFHFRRKKMNIFRNNCKKHARKCYFFCIHVCNLIYSYINLNLRNVLYLLIIPVRNFPNNNVTRLTQSS